MKYKILLLIIIAFASAAMACHAEPVHGHHPFDHVEIANSDNRKCSFRYSPVDFCDDRHVLEMRNALNSKAANFNKYYILLKIKEWRPSEHYGDSIVILDTRTGVAYPMPFDYYTGAIHENNSKTIQKSKLVFSENNDEVCIIGAIMVYRSITNGNFCFFFDGKTFSGYRTEYMD